VNKKLTDTYISRVTSFHIDVLERPAVSIARVSEEINIKVGQIFLSLLLSSPDSRCFRVKLRGASKIDGFCRQHRRPIDLPRSLACEREIKPNPTYDKRRCVGGARPVEEKEDREIEAKGRKREIARFERFSRVCRRALRSPDLLVANVLVS